MVVAPDIQTLTFYGLVNGTSYTFTLKAADNSGNYSSPRTISATPVSSSSDTAVTIDPPVAPEVVIGISGNVAVLHTGSSPMAMTVSAILSGGSGWTWYLDGQVIHSGSSTVIISTTYASPNPPYPLKPGVHNLVLVVAKDGQLYSREIPFSVFGN
ncbi:MAG: hypothetical protein ABIJ86_10525 [Spirochaetota bacterium]